MELETKFTCDKIDWLKLENNVFNKIKSFLHLSLLITILIFVYRLSVTTKSKEPLVSFEKRYHHSDGLKTKIENYTGSPTTSATMYSYIPAYSHVYLDEGRVKEFAVTLSLRNIDMKNSIKILEVFYFDTKGKLLRKYLAEGKELLPLETAEIFIKSEDIVGGSGANFTVLFHMSENTLAPIFETVMVSNKGNDYSFTSRGVIYSASKIKN